MAQVGGLLPGGLSVRGLSGGEKRRLSMACGVVGAPKIIYLDEPTSGLDGNAALVVMECMGRLAAQRRIIVSSIHQPRAAIWELFSKVQVLSEGRMLYFGATSQVRAHALAPACIPLHLRTNLPPSSHARHAALRLHASWPRCTQEGAPGMACGQCWS